MIRAMRVVSFLVLASVCAWANTVAYVPSGPNIGLTFDGVSFTLDVRGVDLGGAVWDLDTFTIISSPTPFGDVTLLGGAAPGFGNNVMFLSNGALTELLQFNFDFASAILDSGKYFIPVTTVPLTGLTDPGLMALGGATGLIGSFNVVAFNERSALFSLETVSGSAVPEPATAGLLGLGLVTVIVARRKSGTWLSRRHR